jgi:acetyl esterase/lipase
MQEVLGFSPLRTGVAYLPITVGFIVVAGVGARLIGRTGAKWLMTAGMLVTAVAFLLLARLPDHGSYAVDILPAFIVLPLGAGLAFLSVTNAAVAGVAPQDSGLASALLNTCQQTGGAVGLGLLATIAATRTNSVLAGSPHAILAHALVQGFHLAFLVAAGIAAAGAIVAVLTVPTSIGRVPRVPVSYPLQAQAVTAQTATPSSALAACAACSPVTRHALVPEAPTSRKPDPTPDPELRREHEMHEPLTYMVATMGGERAMSTTERPPLPSLDATIERFRHALAAQGGPPLYTLCPEEARALVAGVQTGQHLRFEADSTDCTISGGPTGEIALRIVRPCGVPGPLPVVLYFHGGWVLGDKDTHDRLVREIAAGAQATVVFVAYDRAPEVQYPVAVEQAYAATQWVATNSASIRVDATRLAVAGDGAGGTLAAAVTLLAKERGGPRIAVQVLFYPVTDATFDTASYDQFADGPWLTRGRPAGDGRTGPGAGRARLHPLHLPGPARPRHHGEVDCAPHGPWLVGGKSQRIAYRPPRAQRLGGKGALL